MENIKYLIFYALLICVGVLGFLQYHWLVIIPAALVLSGGYILVKGASWKEVMGKNTMNGGIVFVATFISQIVLSGILYGIGHFVAYLFS